MNGKENLFSEITNNTIEGECILFSLRGLITIAIFGNKMHLKHDSYLSKNHHLMYIFNGPRAIHDLAPNLLIQEQIICMYKEIDEDSSREVSC